MKLVIELAKFSAQDAERITGLSAMRQRDYRRHGYLPQISGHARFDVFQLAEMFVLRLMQERNIGPREAKTISDICALGVVWHALMPGSFDGDHDKLVDAGILPKYNSLSDNQVTAFNEALQARGKDPISDLNEQLAVESDKEYLRRRLWTSAGKLRIVPAEYFIWWADGSHHWCDKIDEAFDDVADQDPKRNGPVIILSQVSLGDQLLRKANCAFASVAVVEDIET